MSSNKTKAEAFLFDMQDLMRKHKVDTIYGIRTEEIRIQSHENNWNWTVESIDTRKESPNASI